MSRTDTAARVISASPDYGLNHTGACLIFDRELLRQQVETTFLSRTGYRLYGCRLYGCNVTYRDYGSDEIDAFRLRSSRVEAVGLDAAVEEHFET
jgi:hypothetical protein